jgi:hypothetical protein
MLIVRGDALSSTSGSTPIRAVIVSAALALASFVAFQTRADADLWGHLTFGRDIVAHHDVVRTDPYSFTSDRQWINHEWLAEVAMYASWKTGGNAGLVLAKASIVFATFGLVWWVWARSNVPLIGRALLLSVVSVGVLLRSHTFRPQVFSLLLFVVLLVVLKESERSRRGGWLWTLPPLFALWVNLHGGWIVGGAVLAIWALFELLDHERSWKHRLTPLLIGICALVATLLNPYGFAMWQFLWETVGLGRERIGDWQPAWRVLPSCVVLVICTALIAAVYRHAPVSFRSRATVIAVILGVLTVRVSRLDAFCALAVAVLFAPAYGKVAAAMTGRTGASHAAPIQDSRLTVWLSVSAALLTLFLSGSNAWGGVRCVQWPAQEGWPEPELVSFVKANELRGRMLTWFNFGEYAIWHFAPDITISFDGRRETVYSEGFMERHNRFYDAPTAYAGFPDEIGADFVWLPRFIKVGPVLEKRGWVRLFEGRTSTIWSRRALPLRYPTLPVTGERCFPGP